MVRCIFVAGLASDEWRCAVLSERNKERGGRPAEPVTGAAGGHRTEREEEEGIRAGVSQEGRGSVTIKSGTHIPITSITTRFPLPVDFLFPSADAWLGAPRQSSFLSRLVRHGRMATEQNALTSFEGYKPRPDLAASSPRRFARCAGRQRGCSGMLRDGSRGRRHAHE